MRRIAARNVGMVILSLKAVTVLDLLTLFFNTLFAFILF